MVRVDKSNSSAKFVFGLLCWLQTVVCSRQFCVSSCRLIAGVFWKQCIFISMIVCLLIHFQLSLIAACIINIFGIVLFLRCLENCLLYQSCVPQNSRLVVEVPCAYDMPHYESVRISSSHCVQLHAYFIKHPSLSTTCPTILYFHGNAGNIGHRLVNVFQLVNFCDTNVFIVDYRGYGYSSGVPYEKGLYEDAKACLQYLLARKDIDNKKIVVFGRSLGGAVGIYLCAKSKMSPPIRALIVENTFTSLPNISRRLFNLPFFHLIPDCLLFNKYPSFHLVSTLNVPVLFISGLNDALVPPDMMQQLYSACGSSFKDIALFPGKGHNDTWTSSNYYECVRNYLTKVMESQTRELNEGDTILHL